MPPNPLDASNSRIPDLSVIVVSWNVRDMLKRCLTSIFLTALPLDIEVIVIDNASSDGSAEMVASHFPAVKLIVNEANSGFSKANNQGIRVCRGRMIALLNPDTEVMPGALQEMADYLHTHADAGIVGPAFLDSANRVIANGVRFPTVRMEIARTLGLTRWVNLEHDFGGYESAEYGASWPVDSVSGACLVIKREVIEMVAGLDERLFMFYEEVDLCYRAVRAGWRIAFIPHAKVYHFWMGSVRQAPIRSTVRFCRSQFRYFRKHYGWPSAVIVFCLGAPISACRILRILTVWVRDRIRRAIRTTRWGHS